MNAIRRLLWKLWLPRPVSKRPTSQKRRLTALLRVEALEDRAVPAVAADLIAYRPDTLYMGSVQVADSQEEDYKLGAGIRINGDDDNNNGVADYNDTTPLAAKDNDLLRVDVSAVGTSASITFTDNLRVWTTQTKSAEILNGGAITSGTVWIEYTKLAQTTGATSAVIDLSVSDGGGTATDKLVLHSFQSIVIAIGGNGQDPASSGATSQSVFAIGANLYRQGYDVQLYRHDQVSSSGAGAAYDEVVRAVQSRNVDYVSIFGFSWGGGATYELAKGLQANTAIKSQYTLSYTAYIDAITHNSLSSERRLPPGTAYHDNIYQRRDWLLRGNSVTGANTNLNVTNTSWGKNLTHTTIDDNINVQNIIIDGVTSHVIR